MKTENKSKKRKCINKDKVNKRVLLDELQDYLDAGWKIGVYKTQEQLDEWRQKFSNTYWNKSEEEKQKLKRKNSEGNKRRWQNATEEEKLLQSQRSSKTTKELWDSLSDDERQQREINRLQTRNKWSDEYKQQLSKKLSESAKRDRSQRTREKFLEISRKCFETRRRNNTLNSSQPEDVLYQNLLHEYDNVIRSYNLDSRYPYHCDFYIPSEDLFIELNYFPTHYTEPFNENNPNHIKLLEQYKFAPKNWIEEASVNIWAGSDKEKIDCAKRNNLKYIAVYKDKTYYINCENIDRFLKVSFKQSSKVTEKIS